MKHVSLLIWKEFTQLRRDPLLLRLILLMPVMQLVMFGYVVGADVKNLRTAVVDLDRTATSRQLASSFEGSGYFRIVAHPASETDLKDLLDKGGAAVALVIPEQTESRMMSGRTVPVAIVVDGSDSRTAALGSGYAAQIISAFNEKRLRAMGVRLNAPGIDARVRVLFNPSMRLVNTMIPSLVAFALMITQMSIMSQAVVRERESGTLEQMFVTPITRGEYLIGKITPYLVASVAQIALVAITGQLLFHVGFHGSVLVFLTGIFLFMLLSIGGGLLISLVSHTRTQAQQTVMFIMIPSMVLSGFIFPIESMPPLVVPLTYLIPLRYAVTIFRAAAVKGSGFEALWPSFVMMTSFALAIFGIALSRFHKRLSD